MNEKNAIRDHRRGTVASGVIFLVVGVLLLANTLGNTSFIPDAFFSWPLVLIALGIVSGIKHRFRNFGSFLMIGIGGAFLAEKLVQGQHFGNLIFPVVILAFGLHLLTGKTAINRRQGRFE